MSVTDPLDMAMGELESTIVRKCAVYCRSAPWWVWRHRSQRRQHTAACEARRKMADIGHETQRAIHDSEAHLGDRDRAEYVDLLLAQMRDQSTVVHRAQREER